MPGLPFGTAGYGAIAPGGGVVLGAGGIPVPLDVAGAVNVGAAVPAPGFEEYGSNGAPNVEGVPVPAGGAPPAAGCPDVLA